MRMAVSLAVILTLSLGAASGRAQGLLSGKPTAQQASVAAQASAATVAPGASVTLWADVTPHPSMHVYAEGAVEFTPVAVKLTPHASVSFGKASYPKPALVAVPGTAEKVPAYSQPFRIAVPVTVKPTAKSGDTLTLGGAVNYQACDDRLCYPGAVAPVRWTLAVK